MQVSRLLMVASASILMSVAAFGQAAKDTVFQIHYFSNLTISDTVINITDSGASIGTQFAVNGGSPVLSNALGPCTPQNPCSSSGAAASVIGNGNLCVNAYLFSANEELQACCSCFVTPNGLWSWDILNDLVPNALEGPASLIPGGVVKLVATLAGTTSATSGCDATMAGLPTNTFNFVTGKFNTATNSVLAPGMLAWARGQISATSVGVESSFAPATLSSGNGTYTISPGLVANGGPSEIARMAGQCATFQSAPVGICKSCRLGGL
jgi:hypothetical protein